MSRPQDWGRFTRQTCWNTLEQHSVAAKDRSTSKQMSMDLTFSTQTWLQPSMEFHYQPRALRPNKSCHVNRREWHCYSASFGSRNTWKDVAWARHGTERLVLRGFTQMVHETRTTASSHGFRPLRREWSDIKPKMEE